MRRVTSRLEGSATNRLSGASPRFTFSHVAEGTSLTTLRRDEVMPSAASASSGRGGSAALDEASASSSETPTDTRHFAAGAFPPLPFGLAALSRRRSGRGDGRGEGSVFTRGFRGTKRLKWSGKSLSASGARNGGGKCKRDRRRRREQLPGVTASSPHPSPPKKERETDSPAGGSVKKRPFAALCPLTLYSSHITGL